MRLLLFIAIAFTTLSCSGVFDLAKEESAIRDVMAEQEIAWNQGDIPAFMKGYWKNDSLVFIGSNVTYGWQATLDNYLVSYPTKQNMGQLSFDIMQVDVTSATTAHVIGKWHLARQSMVDAGGHYSLLWRKIDGKWLIVADHSS